MWKFIQVAAALWLGVVVLGVVVGIPVLAFLDGDWPGAVACIATFLTLGAVAVVLVSITAECDRRP